MVAPGLQRRARRIVMRLLNKQHASGLDRTAQQVLRTLVDEVPSQVTEADQVEFRRSHMFTPRTDGELQVLIRRVLVQHDPPAVSERPRLPLPTLSTMPCERVCELLGMPESMA
jgi:hypothetical protein